MYPAVQYYCPGCGTGPGRYTLYCKLRCPAGRSPAYLTRLLVHAPTVSSST